VLATLSYRRDRGVAVLTTDSWPGHAARRALTGELERLTRRSNRHGLTHEERRERILCSKGLLDIDASYRALLRYELEGCRNPLDLVLLQVEENELGGLPLDTIDPATLIAARRYGRLRDRADTTDGESDVPTRDGSGTHTADGAPPAASGSHSTDEPIFDGTVWGQ
jgi:hypothetical protein